VGVTFKFDLENLCTQCWFSLEC